MLFGRLCLGALCLTLCRAQMDTYPSPGPYDSRDPRYPDTLSTYPGQGPPYQSYPEPTPSSYPGYSTPNAAGSGYPGSNRQYSSTTDPSGFEHFSVIYEWFKLDYTWPDDSRKAQALQSSMFISDNNVLASAKVWRDRIFVTIPRWRRGVPATLATIALNPPDRNASPRLQPFPSWRMQELGNCSALQFVQSIEIDTLGRMWIIDTGRVHILDRAEIRCPPKLVILDLKGDYNYNINNNNNNNYSDFGGQGRDFNNMQGRNRNDYNPGNPDYNYNANNNRDFNNRDYNNQGRDYNSPQGRDYNPQTGGGYNQGRDFPDYNRNNQYNPDYNNRQNEYGRPQNSFEARNPIGDYNPQGIPSFTPEPTYNHESGGGGYNNQQNQNTNPRTRMPFRDMEMAQVIRVFTFPEAVASKEDSHLVDIVLDDTDGYFAYISDASDPDPGIIVYSFRDNKARKVRDYRSMRAEPSLRSIYVNNQQVQVQYNLAGLALSPNNGSNLRTLYYAPFSSRNLYSIPTQALRDPTLQDPSTQVKLLGEKSSTVQAMTMSNRGILYYGLVENNTISRWDTHRQFYGNQRSITRDQNLLQWPMSFNIDERGDLYVVSNKYQNFIKGPIDSNQPNFRIIRGRINQKSYLYPDEGPLDLGTFQPAASSPRDNWQSYDSRGGASSTSFGPFHGLLVLLAAASAARVS